MPSAISSPSRHFTQTWVTPDVSQETIDQTFPLSVPLVTADHGHRPVPIIQVLPGLLEVERLKASLRPTLASFLHCCGSMRINGEVTNIVWQNRGIPLTVVTTETPYNHYQPLEVLPREMFDCMAWDRAQSGGPLLSLKLTLCPTSNETCIGMLFSHCLGDIRSMLNFFVVWSARYQGLPSPIPPPTYTAFKRPPPAYLGPDTDVFAALEAPNLNRLRPVDDPVDKSFACVELMFSDFQLQQLALVAEGPFVSKEMPQPRMSRQNALSGYLMTVYNRCLETPTTRVAHVINYSVVPSPVNDECTIDPNSTGNHLVVGYTQEIDPRDAYSIRTIATHGREATVRTRRFEYLKKLLGVATAIFQRGGIPHGMRYRHTSDGYGDTNIITHNGASKFSFRQAHFGFSPDTTRTIFHHVLPGHWRFLSASPTLLADGKTWESNKGAIMVMMRVPGAIRDRFLGIIASEINSPSFPQNLLRREAALENERKERVALESMVEMKKGHGCTVG